MLKVHRLSLSKKRTQMNFYFLFIREGRIVFFSKRGNIGLLLNADAWRSASPSLVAYKEGSGTAQKGKKHAWEARVFNAFFYPQ